MSKDSPSVRDDSDFGALLGQDSAVAQLTAALKSGRVPHAYLFTGPTGVGRRSAARAWAKILLCPHPPRPDRACGACPSCARVETGAHPDLLWVDFTRQAALLKEPIEKQRTLRIGTVRQMEQALRLKPLQGSVKIAVLSPAEALGEDAAHALLKIVEEPPPGTHLVLVSDTAGAVLGTLRSRCQHVRFSPLTTETLAALLAGARPDAGPEAVRRAAVRADGSYLRAREILERGEGLDFDWETAPLSEALQWCDGFQNPRLGRAAAERFLEDLLGRFQAEAREGRRDPAILRPVLRTLGRVRGNGLVSLNLTQLILHLRRESRAAGSPS
jgi:DNA polymerase-3 subunit delta'